MCMLVVHLGCRLEHHSESQKEPQLVDKSDHHSASKKETRWALLMGLQKEIGWAGWRVGHLAAGMA